MTRRGLLRSALRIPARWDLPSEVWPAGTRVEYLPCPVRRDDARVARNGARFVSVLQVHLDLAMVEK